MSKVFLVGQRPVKKDDGALSARLKFFSNREDPTTKKPTWYSWEKGDFCEESVIDTKRWMENEEFDDFSLEFIYD